MENNDINYFAETTFRNQRKRFGIKPDDRRRHVYAIGKTGMGKTVMMENMVIQDIQKGHGVGVVDPHGEFAEKMLDFIPNQRINDVIYFNPADLNYPIAFNVMEKVDPEHRHLVAAGVMGVFKKIWVDVWSARMEYILNNTILALLEYAGATLLGINRMLADQTYRQRVIDKVTDPVVRAYWTTEFARYTQRYEVEATAAIQNKVGQFISAPIIRNIVGQIKSTFDMRKVMDEGKILIMNISKGKVGEDNSRLLGALLITKLQLAAMERIDVPEEQRKDFYLYVDEFQNFATDAFAGILSEARKYHLCLTLGHQYIAQMDETVCDAVFGNVGTIVSFRVGAEDAERLEKEFAPEFYIQDFVNLAKYNIYLKLMIDGIAGRPFSAETLAPFQRLEKSNREKIIKVSRERYGTPRKEVEGKIARWSSSLAEQLRAMPKPSEPPKLYEATCSVCGKRTRVIFEPQPGRPVYCEKCLKDIRSRSDRRDRAPEEKEAKSPSSERRFEASPGPVDLPRSPRDEGSSADISLEELSKKEPVFFHPRKEKDSPQEEKTKVNLEELRGVLEESLGEDLDALKQEQENVKNNEKINSQAPSSPSGQAQENNINSRKILRPGERIQF